MATILVITQRVPFPPNKGEKLRTYHQLAYLKALGHHITVFSPIDCTQDTKDAESLSKKLGIEVITHALPHKLFRFANGILTGRALSEANFYSKALLQKIEARAADADAILCSASSLAPYVFSLKKNPHTRLLMDFMDVDSDKWTQYATSSTWPMRQVYKRESKLIRALEQKIVEHFDACFLIAEAEKSLFTKQVMNSEKVIVLGNGIDQSEFSANKNANNTENAVHFLFTGVMDYKPNVDAVLWFIQHCWLDIKQALPNARFTIAGMNPTSDIKNLALEDKSIEVTGFVEDIMPYFHRAEVFVAPFQLARGVQNKVLQAMSCGIPVVSTALGAEGIACRHEEHIILADHPKAFIKACIDLANNLEQKQTIGSNAQRLIRENYSWEGVLKPLQHALTDKVML